MPPLSQDKAGVAHSGQKEPVTHFLGVRVIEPPTPALEEKRFPYLSIEFAWGTLCARGLDLFPRPMAIARWKRHSDD